MSRKALYVVKTILLADFQLDKTDIITYKHGPIRVRGISAGRAGGASPAALLRVPIGS